MSFYSQIGELILGTRLKRISERFLVDISKIYKSQNIPFEPSWFSIFYLLDKNNQMSIGEISSKTDISQSGVSQMINVLMKKGMVQYAPNGHDKRVRLICFTELGFSTLQEIKPIWKSIKKSLQVTLSERENSAYLLPALDEFEDAIEEKSFYLRVTDDLKRRKLGDIQLIPFEESFIDSYKYLLLEWFTDNDSIEVADFDFVNNPQQFIKEKKGTIYLAFVQESIISVVVTLFNSKSIAEIIVFIMDENWRLNQIGKNLINQTILKLSSLGKKEIRLTMNRKRIWEIKLFKEAGFILQSLSSNQKNENFINIKMLFQQ